MEIDLRDLELLESLGRHKTLTATAAQLYVSQPALSQRLTRLEGRLDTSLFERRGRRLIPTAAGRRLFEVSALVLRELRAAEHDVRELREGRRRPLRLASQCTTNYQWLAGVLREFRETVPGGDVRIETVADDNPIPALLDDQIDIALVTKLDRQMDHVHLQHLFDSEMVAVVARTHPWAERGHVEADDFGDIHLMLFDSYDPLRVPAVPLPLPAGAQPGRLTTMPVVTDLLIEMVAAGDIVTVLPSWIARPYLSSHDLVTVQVGTTPLTRTWYCATRHGTRPEHLQVFVDLLIAHLAVDRITAPLGAGPGDPRG